MNLYLILILGFLLFQAVLEFITKILNLRHLQPTLPQEMKGFFDEEKYAQSQQYTRVQTRFSLLASFVSLVAIIVFIFWGGFNRVDLWVRGLGYSPLITGLLFAGVLFILSTLLDLPFEIYATFRIEARFGFNKTTLGTFVLDFVKNLLLSMILGGLVLAGILWFFMTAGSWAWLYAWLAVLGFSFFMQFLAPIVIMPLFNKFTPLPESPLKSAITDYADKIGFKIQGIYTMDGSRRSTKLNAYFTGFGKFKRIVFFDTLIQKLSTEEILSVLAHEMGHFKLKHIWKMQLTSFFTTGMLFFLLSLFLNNSQLSAAFQMEHISVYATLIFFFFLYAPVNFILSLISGFYSRKHEYEADRYSIQTYPHSHAMISALKKLSVENLSNLTPHPLYVLFYYSHPPVLMRINAIKDAEPVF